MVSEGAVDEKSLTEMLERQHQIIIAAIRAGKIEQLIKRSAQAQGAAPPPSKTQPLAPKPAAEPASPANAEPGNTAPTELLSKPGCRASGPLVDFNLDQIIAGYLQPEEARERMSIELLTSPLFVAGDHVKVRAAVLFEHQRPADNATVRLQIVGTRIKPQTFVSSTDQKGIVNFAVTLPSFTSGTAALILQAEAPKGQEAEIKFLIRRR
jgi:hypothetical protein